MSKKVNYINSLFRTCSLVLKHFSLNEFSVVASFGIQKAKGKKVYVYDHLNTSVDSDEILQYLIETQKKTLVLIITFNEVRGNSEIGEQDVVTSQVNL